MKQAGMAKTEFAKVMGVDRAQPTRWAQRGMPLLADGTVDAAPAAEWVRVNVQNFKLRGSNGAGQLQQAERRRYELEIVSAYRLGDEMAALVAAELLLPLLPEPTVRSLVAELYRRLRTGSVDCLDEHVAPPRGCASWADDQDFMKAAPAEGEWDDLLAKATAAGS